MITGTHPSPGWLVNDGVGLHWREDGDPNDPPILFLNSLGTDLRLWDQVLPAFSGYRCIRMDTRGHGLSDAPLGNYSLDLLVADAGALIEHLDLTDLTIIGVSLGGMMAQTLTVQMPDRVSKLVLSNTGLRMGDAGIWADRIAAVKQSGVSGIADAVLDRWFAAAFRKADTVGLWRNMMIRTPDQGYTGCCAALRDADLSASSSSISCPTLVIGGSDDAASPPALVKSVADAIPAATYVELADVGHLPMVEAPDEFARVVTSFMKDKP